jgi:hypothetical protein
VLHTWRNRCGAREAVGLRGRGVRESATQTGRNDSDVSALRKRGGSAATASGTGRRQRQREPSAATRAGRVGRSRPAPLHACAYSAPKPTLRGAGSPIST